MRVSLLAWSLLSLFSIPALAAPSDNVSPSHHLVKRGDSDVKSEGQSTTFNGIEVPPMKALTPDNFDDTIKDGYWYVVSSFYMYRWSSRKLTRT